MGRSQVAHLTEMRVTQREARKRARSRARATLRPHLYEKDVETSSYETNSIGAMETCQADDIVLSRWLKGVPRAVHPSLPHAHTCARITRD